MSRRDFLRGVELDGTECKPHTAIRAPRDAVSVTCFAAPL